MFHLSLLESCVCVNDRYSTCHTSWSFTRVRPRPKPLAFHIPFLTEKITLWYTFDTKMVTLWSQGGGGGGGGVLGILSDGDDTRIFGGFEMFYSGIFLGGEIWQVFWGWLYLSRDFLGYY